MSSKKIFIKQYAALVEQILRNNLHNPFIWGTFLTNRNSFHSPLSPFLECIYCNKQEESPLIISNTASLRSLFLALRNIVNLFIKLIMLKILTLCRPNKSILYTSKKVTIIKTFAYEESFNDGKFNDLFFGQLPYYLKRHGKNVITLYDPLGPFFDLNLKGLNIKEVDSIYYYLKISDLLLITIQIIRSFLTPLKGKYSFQNQDITKRINRQYKRDRTNTTLIKGLMMHYIVKRISKRFTIESWIQTYENTEWERVTNWAIKKYSPTTKLIGYQHSVVPERSMNYFIHENEEKLVPLPDKIFTTGKETCDILKEYGGYKNIPVEPACALRYEYLEKINPFNEKIEKRILLAVDGVSPSIDMLNCAFKDIEKLKDWQIVIRTHPIMPYYHYRSNTIIDIDKYDNIKLSCNSLEVDLRTCSIIVYWGSTVALEGIKIGKPVVAFREGRLLSFDPLFRCKHLKWHYSKTQSLARSVNDIYTLKHSKLNEMRELALKYINSYFHSVTDENLSRFL